MSVKGSTKASRDSGGTAAFLPAERAKASFDVGVLTKLVSGLKDEDAKERKEWMGLFNSPTFDKSRDVLMDRKTAMLKSVERTVEAHTILKKNPDLKNTHMNAMLGMGGPGFQVTSSSQSSSSAGENHYGIFVGALLARSSPEQLKVWLPRALNLKIMGAYGQTELGHGSNVRGLETVATYDATTEEFVIHSPTLSSTKWWPGCFGIVATHAVIYARLILDGKDVGVHEFMVQLRDEHHRPMPGVEVGDVGPKTGYNLVDNGYARFDHVRVPRFNMLAKQAEVTKDGKYVSKKVVKKDKGGAGGKLKYIVMIQTRVSMVHGAYKVSAAAATIATRYSAVRHQGFKNTRKDSLASGENPVLDYQVQQYRIFKTLSMAFAYCFTSHEIIRQLNTFRKNMSSGDVSTLPELHATAAGLKAFCTNYAGDAIEDCRRCCGGHGSLMSSGIGSMVCDFNAISPIAEGDKIVLALQTARFLVRALQGHREGKPLSDMVTYIGGAPAPDFSSKASLRDLDNLVAAFAWRARNSVIVATDGFEARLKAGDPFDVAWNKNAVDLVKAADDHCQYVILSRFVATISRVEDAGVRTVLSRLAAHFALVQVRERGMDFVGVVDAKSARAVQVEVTTLLAEIRPDSVALVDCFGLTDGMLRHSALGRADGNYMEALWEFATESALNDPKYVSQIRERLAPKLDVEYLREGMRTQRAGATAAPRSKL